MDGDAFFVAVEVAKNPKLRGLPVVTGQERGIVTALSYEAKALGVSRGLPIFQLKKIFPQVVILPGDYAAYADYSSRMFDIVRRYADDVEEYSIDECFADLTGFDIPLKMSYGEIALRIQNEITEELDISVSIGIAPTKVLAKVASKWKKPHGLTVIDFAHIDDFLKEISIHVIWGIGPSTSQVLMKQGIHTARDLAQKSESWADHFLDKHIYEIWKELNGISVFPIDPYQKTNYVSMQRTRTFYPTTNNKDFLFSQISKHLEDVCAKARHYKLVSKKVSIFLKLQTFRYVRAEIKLSLPTNVPEIILPLLEHELTKLHKPGVLYRAAGVTLHDLSDSGVKQGDLFGDGARIGKFDAIHEQIDALEDKFGKQVVYLASTKQALKNKTKGATDHKDLDRNLLFL